ncbi:MAG: hypothetical protein M3444_06845 [Acidobacteriota bacterium]|nr:hypothetical protein [Acidobacteriota bacterium]
MQSARLSVVEGADKIKGRACFATPPSLVSRIDKRAGRRVPTAELKFFRVREPGRFRVPSSSKGKIRGASRRAADEMRKRRLGAASCDRSGR